MTDRHYAQDIWAVEEERQRIGERDIVANYVLWSYAYNFRVIKTQRNISARPGSDIHTMYGAL